MWCGVLGPLEVRDSAGEPITVGGSARRLLLAALISRVGHTVAPDVLIEDIWGAVPPRSALGTLRSHVVRLRSDLGRDAADSVLVTDRLGYRLQLAAEEVDAAAFGARVQDAQRASEDEDALRRLDTALTLWRGDPYVEFPDAAFCVAERVRLVELRELAEERRTDIALRLGQAAELVAGLEKRVAAAPYRERSWEQLMLALYRSGRQADALGAYRRASERLVEDLGVDPGPALRELEERILRQDPDLLLTTPVPVRARPRPPQPDRCPYRGLASYQDADDDVFVGRERLTGQIVGRLAEHRVVVVAGASGTGKSSVLRAGVLPALRRGALPGSAAWRTAALNPGDVTGPAIGGLDLVVVDQGEELFSRLDAEARAAVVDALEQFAESGGRVVIALRADFYGRLADVQPFGAYAQAATVLVGPLRPDELRRVIVEPAGRVGLTCEPDLVEAVLDDVGAAPAALPLLSAALVRVWQNREGTRLTLDGYRRSGGVASAIEDTAEEAYASIAEDDRPAAQRLLVRMAELEGETWVRRPLRRSDVAADPATERAVGVLAAARLVSVSNERVELTHETLLEHWPRLRTWLAERALAADLLTHLGSAAAEWHASGRAEADLYRGARLQAATDWAEQHPGDVSPAEHEFLSASSAAAQHELREARQRADREARGRRRLRSVVAVLAVVVALAVAATVVALSERSSARRSATSAERSALSADARRLAALSVNAPDIATSSLLAVAAYKLQDSADTRGALLSAVERNQSALWRIQTARRPQRFSLTADNSRIVLSDNSNTARIFDTKARKQLSAFMFNGGWVEGISPDGARLVTFGQGPLDFDPTGRLAVYDAATGRQVKILTTSLDPNGLEPVSSDDDHWLAGVTAPSRHVARILIWQLTDLNAPPLSFPIHESPQSLAINSRSVAVENLDGSVDVRALPSLQLIGRVPPEPTQVPPNSGFVAVSADGRLVVRGNPGDDRRCTIYGVGPGAPAPVVLPSQPQTLFVAAMSPDAKRVALGSASGSVAVYDTATGGLDEALSGHAGPVTAVRWTGTGLYTIGLDSQIISWTVSAGSRLIRFSGPDLRTPDRGEVFGRYVLGLSPRFGAVPSSQEKLLLANLDRGSVTQWPAKLKDGPSDNFTGEYVNQAVASFDGKRALVSVNDQTGLNHIDIWDLVRHQRIGMLHLPGSFYRHFIIGLVAAISPDGSTAYAAIDRDHIGVFTLPSGRMTRSFALGFTGPNADRVVDIPWQFDPSGRLLVYGYDTGPYRKGIPTTFPTSRAGPINHRWGLLDVKTGKWLARVSYGDSTVDNIAWSPDGRLLAIGTYEGTLTTYDAATLRVRSAAGPVEPGFVQSVSFSPDGRTIVTGGTAGSLSFFDAADLSREGTPLPIGVGANNGGVFAWFDRRGNVVGLGNDPAQPGTTLHRWFTFAAEPSSLVRTACDLAGTDITRAQWQRYVGDRPYRSVCPHSS